MNMYIDEGGGGLFNEEAVSLQITHFFNVIITRKCKLLIYFLICYMLCKIVL